MRARAQCNQLPCLIRDKLWAQGDMRGTARGGCLQVCNTKPSCSASSQSVYVQSGGRGTPSNQHPPTHQSLQGAHLELRGLEAQGVCWQAPSEAPPASHALAKSRQVSLLPCLQVWFAAMLIVRVGFSRRGPGGGRRYLVGQGCTLPLVVEWQHLYCARRPLAEQGGQALPPRHRQLRPHALIRVAAALTCLQLYGQQALAVLLRCSWLLRAGALLQQQAAADRYCS